jgi:L-aminopeptidase/D-esterase-like protein
MSEAAAGMATNTTIGAILTNANLTKAQLCKVAGMAHDGLARCIYPVHTSMDGDSVYALSTGGAAASTDLVGMLAAEAIAEAILVAAKSATDAFGIPCASSVR